MNELFRRMLFLPEQASTFSVPVDNLHYIIITTTMLVATAVGLAALLMFWRYRRRVRLQLTEMVTPHLGLEILFIIVPMVVFLAWFAIGFRDFVRQSTPPPDAMDVYVEGKKWMWKFSYPEGLNSVGVLHVPANRPVRLLLTSQDVIHSFFVPAFRLKMDVIPGRYTQTWFTATQTGNFQVLCAEFCGTEHSMMWAEIVVLAPEEWDRWRKEQMRGLVARKDVLQDTSVVPPGGILAEQGRRIAVQQGCFKCHSIDGEPHIGPTWMDLYMAPRRFSDETFGVADEAYLTESMMEPLKHIVSGYQAVMPVYQGRLSGPDAAALVEYIKTLRSDRTEPRPNSSPAYEPVPIGSR
nr:cytochrome c oxidase subunit 2 [uncultured bacterium]